MSAFATADERALLAERGAADERVSSALPAPGQAAGARVLTADLRAWSLRRSFAFAASLPVTGSGLSGNPGSPAALGWTGTASAALADRASDRARTVPVTKRLGIRAASKWPRMGMKVSTRERMEECDECVRAGRV
ncbi:hypothetical protein C3489_11205 [Streptomyces sp. Ru71]|nr:hypothetical protein C3489_11205 [Streptomyces sp. Ru71]